MAADESNLVLGAAWNLTIDDVFVFVESLRRYYQGEAALLISGQRAEEITKYLRSRSVTPIFFDCPHWMVMHIQLARFVRYEELLRGADKIFNRVLLTDVSDVVFQGDPFAKLPEGELLCFLEAPGRTIGQCEANSRWLADIYGAQVVQQLKDYEISCSGTTIGSHAAILKYIHLLLREARPGVLLPLRRFRGHDQGIHNYLLRTGALPEARLIPNGRHVVTVGCIASAEFGCGPRGILGVPGRPVCPIVHQYTYWDGASAHVRAAYGSAPVAIEKKDWTPRY
jgi:hypothetical protein